MEERLKEKKDIYVQNKKDESHEAKCHATHLFILWKVIANCND